jgi:hypothetical protein
MVHLVGIWASGAIGPKLTCTSFKTFCMQTIWLYKLQHKPGTPAFHLSTTTINNMYLTADFGMEPYTKTLRPLYNPNTPCLWTVFLTQSQMPEYCLAVVPAFSSNWSCVFTYSVGYVIHISMPPVIPPGKQIRTHYEDRVNKCTSNI